jgi:hypothetical protein
VIATGDDSLNPHHFMGRASVDASIPAEMSLLSGNRAVLASAKYDPTDRWLIGSSTIIVCTRRG